MRLSSILAFVLIVALGGPAAAKGVHYLGGHPIATKLGGGYCYIDAPHLHVYGPDRPQLYQKVGEEHVFAADPTPFGYDGEKHPFYGHHPVVTVAGEPVFCYLDGPHYHPFEAPDLPDYKVKKGVAFYVGPIPPQVLKLAPQRVKVVNAEYRPFVAQRPTIEVTPPEGWGGEVWVPPPVTVSAPGVVVAAPTVQVSAPGVVVAPPSVTVAAPGVVVAAPGVVVAPPGVAVQAPGVVVGGPHVKIKGGRHDNGKHNGWFKR